MSLGFTAFTCWTYVNVFLVNVEVEVSVSSGEVEEVNEVSLRWERR